MNDDDYRALLDDLRAEHDELCSLIDGLTDEQWQWPTPAEGWQIRDQIVHLAFFDDLAVLAAHDEQAFGTAAAELVAGGPGWIDAISFDRRNSGSATLLTWYHRSRSTLLDVFSGRGPRQRAPWFGPPMSAASSVTARLMETWAHGQDIADTLGVERVPTTRVHHVCHLGVLTRTFSYANRDRTPPSDAIRTELTGVDGTILRWGPEDAEQRIVGSAVDFALVATQRRAFADTALRATDGAARDWMAIAQAYAGPPGPGRGRQST
ncbi:TIGR03084 family metal-binding protein [Nakamurella sp. A5-74]|uniref:TIGR03084 family metal-binding protein n=1 Tax=Nakamurella sp. A5-74 TaxID=3158264 RepID=A0AAU8DNT4_9ACTN